MRRQVLFIDNPIQRVSLFWVILDGDKLPFYIYSIPYPIGMLTLLHSERLKLYAVLAFLKG